MKLFLFIITLVTYNIAIGQVPFFCYNFKVFTAGIKKEITSKNNNYKIASLLFHNKEKDTLSTDEDLHFGDFWKDGISKWQIVIKNGRRSFVYIQIIKAGSRDTMNVITDTNDWTTGHAGCITTIDTIVFKKGNFKIISTPILPGRNYSREVKEINVLEMKQFIKKEWQSGYIEGAKLIKSN